MSKSDGTQFHSYKNRQVLTKSLTKESALYICTRLSVKMTT